MTDRPSILAEIHALLESGSIDELRAFRVIARRVMSGGRDQYGPLVLSNDARDFRKEAADECADLLWYVAIQQVLAGYAAQQTPEPTADFDSAETGEHERFDTSDVEVG